VWLFHLLVCLELVGLALLCSAALNKQLHVLLLLLLLLPATLQLR
jgi:hypothetical protein